MFCVQKEKERERKSKRLAREGERTGLERGRAVSIVK